MFTCCRCRQIQPRKPKIISLITLPLITYLCIIDWCAPYAYLTSIARPARCLQPICRTTALRPHRQFCVFPILYACKKPRVCYKNIMARTTHSVQVLSLYILMCWINRLWMLKAANFNVLGRGHFKVFADLGTSWFSEVWTFITYCNRLWMFKL